MLYNTSLRRETGTVRLDMLAWMEGQQTEIVEAYKKCTLHQSGLWSSGMTSS